MARSHYSSKPLHGQRGATAIWFALLLPVLLGFAALAVDLARLNLVKTELQNAADAAALAGAKALTQTGGNPYNWAAAGDTARAIAKKNYANGSKIEYALIETGYWNLQNPALDFRPLGSPGVPASGDVPAVRATVPINKGHNQGPMQLFFAPFLNSGKESSEIESRAIAIIAPPASGTGIFPFSIGSKVFNDFWDSTNNKPKYSQSFQVSLESIYPTGGEGTWTSLTYAIGEGSSDNKTIGGIIKTSGNTTPISIGDKIWIATGTMQDLYQNKKYPLPIGQDIAIPVVEKVSAGWQKIIAIAGFHIDSVGGNGNKSYFLGHFIDATSFSGLNPGSGNGQPYGAYTPPILVQ